MGAGGLRARARSRDRRLLSTDRPARVARRKNCRAEHRRKRLRRTEEAIQFQNARIAGGDRSPHGSSADSRRQLLRISRLVSLARHLLEQIAAHGKEGARSDRLGARCLFLERFRAVSRSTRARAYADRDADCAMESRAALASRQDRQPRNDRGARNRSESHCRVRNRRVRRQTGMEVSTTAEHQRLVEDAARTKNWKRWGPYLSERQWATVREDYSPYGNCWDYFPHDHARSRAYRWGEDGLLGISDRQCRLCFALALWNANDPILKERLFGLTGSEGNHGEDVKELYYYLDSTPTHSYMKALYKYPQAEYPYARLIEENRRRGLGAPELELVDTGVFNEDRYFDVFAEYAKASEDDILIRLTVANRGPEKATLHLLPTLWFRNTWSWGPIPEESTNKPSITLERDSLVRAQHDVLGNYQLAFEGKATPVFTENETNSARIHNYSNGQQFVKDAFHEYVVHGRNDAVYPQNIGTKFAAHYLLEIEPGKSEVVRLRLSATDEAPLDPFAGFEEVFALRMKEADEFYAAVIPSETDDEAKKVARQGYAGLLWSKQFYNYCIREWLSGDPAQPAPPPERHAGRNREWTHLFNRDVISMPDKWEYPWFAAWDLAFHMIPFSKIDPDFAKKQLLLFLREWYMHPNGQIPAYEFAFGDVNPPVHAWAAWRVYKMERKL